MDPIGFPCLVFEVERLDDEDEDTDCNTTAEPAAVDDIIDDEGVIGTVLLLMQCEH